MKIIIIIIKTRLEIRKILLNPSPNELSFPIVVSYSPFL